MSQRPQSMVEKAREAHRSLNGLPFPLLPVQEIVRRVLHLANDCTNEQMEEALLVTMLTHGIPTATLAALSRQHGSNYLGNAWNSISAERDRFREQVEMVYRNRDSARRKLRSEIVAAIDDIVVIPKLTLTGWSVKAELRYFTLDMQASCALALALLLDESNGFGAALKKCKLSPCSNFFLSLSSAKGGRPPLYCSRDHQAAIAPQSGAARTERWRAKKAKKRGKKS